MRLYSIGHEPDSACVFPIPAELLVCPGDRCHQGARRLSVGQRLSIYGYMLIQLGFAVAIFSVTLLFSKGAK